MLRWDDINLEEFLSHNPKLRLTRMNDNEVVIEGEYHVSAQMDGAHHIQETYNLKIILFKDLWRQTPKVFELGGRIPRTPEFHINSDGSCCLGSEIKIKSILFDNSDFSSFREKILDPFLYSISYKLLFNSTPYGELDHGEEGLIDDYQHLFGVKGKLSVLRVLDALSRRKREANKLPCPCGCGSRLGKCNYRFALDHWRILETQQWYREHLKNDFTPIKKPKKKKGKNSSVPKQTESN